MGLAYVFKAGRMNNDYLKELEAIEADAKKLNAGIWGANIRIDMSGAIYSKMKPIKEKL